MKQNFALSLSVEGIVLLHRVPGGWHRVGEVDPAAPDLGAEMATLRKTAQDLDPDGFQTKLVLPKAQIRYLTIDTAQTTVDDVRTAIAAATPVPLDEMVIDFDRNGGRTFVAAVAKQTLREAESFAKDHGFIPVSFVAVPEAFTFSGEVFFGLTTYARETLAIGSSLSREASAPVETGVIAPAPVSATRGQDTAPAAADTPDADVPMPVFRSRATASDTPPLERPIAQFSRSSRQPASVLPTTEPDAPAIPEPVKATPEQSAPQNPAPVAQRRVRSRAISVGEQSDASGLMAQFRSKQDEKSPSGPAVVADMALAKGVAQTDTQRRGPYGAVVLTAALLVTLGLVGVWASTQMDDGVAELLTVDPGLQEDDAALTPQPTATGAASTLENTPATETALAEPPAGEETSEEPPAPIVSEVPGRVLSPGDAARIYAATGVWQRAPRLPDRTDEAPSTLEGIHTFATLPPVQDIAEPGVPDITVLGHDLPILSPQDPFPVNRTVPRDEDGFIRAATNGTVLPTGVLVYGRAPAIRPPLRPTDEPVGLDDSSIPAVQDEIVTEVQFVNFTTENNMPLARAFSAPVLSQPDQIQPPAAQVPQEMVVSDVVTAPATPLPEAGPDLTDTLANTPVTSEPDPAGDTPFATREDDGAPALARPAQSIAALADESLSAPGNPVEEITENTPQEEFDAPAGFVEVIQGRPAVVPPLRPGTPEIALDTQASNTSEAELEPDETGTSDLADAAAGLEITDTVSEDSETPNIEAATAAAPLLFQDPALVGLRPSARPADLLPPSAVTFEAIPALAGIRPLVRPEGLAPAPEPEVDNEAIDAAIADATTVPEADNPDISSIVASIAAAAPPSLIVNPTAQAIATSPRPDARPQNFARVVANVQALRQRQTTRDAAASTSSAVAQNTPQATAPLASQTAPVTGGQTPTTVAQAATVDNAIRLRDMNLIGVYGKPGARRALVRMPNGRFVKVEVGSALDGGQVTAIGDTALNFVKRGRTYALQLPAG